MYSCNFIFHAFNHIEASAVEAITFKALLVKTIVNNNYYVVMSKYSNNKDLR